MHIPNNGKTLKWNSQNETKTQIEMYDGLVGLRKFVDSYSIAVKWYSWIMTNLFIQKKKRKIACKQYIIFNELSNRNCKIKTHWVQMSKAYCCCSRNQ